MIRFLTFNDLLKVVLSLQKALATKFWSNEAQDSTRKVHPFKAKRSTEKRSTSTISETVNCFSDNLQKCLKVNKPVNLSDLY